METKEPRQEKEKTIPPVFQRKTVAVGKRKKKNYSFLLVLLIGFILFSYYSIKHIDWDLVNSVPTIREKSLFSRSYSNRIIGTSSTIKEKSGGKNVEKQNILPKNVPVGYYDFDDIIDRETKKYHGVKSIVIKAIVEQESHYNPQRIRYEQKWEKNYGHKIKRVPGQTLEDWRMNFYSYGLMQISYVLHKDFCELKSYIDLYDPEKNLQCGIKLYSACIEAGNSDTYCIKKHNGSGPSTEIYKNEVMGRIARLLKSSKLLS